jgi:acyl carrier protein
MDQIAQTITKYISEEFMDGNHSGLSSQSSLLEGGIIDSIGIFRLFSFLEETFKVRVPDEDLLAENFETIDKISQYVRDWVQARS